MSPDIYNTGHVAVLEKKSKENYECAKQASLDHNYNAAISRLYYCCLLLTKRCLFELGITDENKLKKVNMDTHTYIIDSYVNPMTADATIPNYLKTHLGYIKALRKHRRKADYCPTLDYTIPVKLGDVQNCNKMAAQYIQAIEVIHQIKII